MIRKLVFLGIAAWLGKKGYDALIEIQNAPGSGAGGTTPLNPVIDPEIAEKLRGAIRAASEVNDPA